MTYAIIGTGAVGGYYGSKLAQAGKDVSFLLHSDYDHVRRNGLKIKSYRGDFVLEKPKVFKKAEDMPVCDVVLVALKTTNNHLLQTLLPPVVGEETLVVLIQNGIGVEEDVQKMFPRMQLAAGLAFICSQKREPGVIDHQYYGMINIGNYSCRNQQRINALLDDFKDAHVKAVEVDYLEARWKKAVWNMPFNGMTVAFNSSTLQLMQNPRSRDIIRRQMSEVVRAANAVGAKGVTEAFADEMMKMTDEMPPYLPSMRLDFDFGRPMEIGYLYDRPIEQARKAGVEMPMLEMLAARLSFF